MKTAFWIAILAALVILLPGIIRGLKQGAAERKAAPPTEPTPPQGDGDAD